MCNHLQPHSRYQFLERAEGFIRDRDLVRPNEGMKQTGAAVTLVDGAGIETAILQLF